jgi:hypothetical protein
MISRGSPFSVNWIIINAIYCIQLKSNSLENTNMKNIKHALIKKRRLQGDAEPPQDYITCTQLDKNESSR